VQLQPQLQPHGQIVSTRLSDSQRMYTSPIVTTTTTIAYLHVLQLRTSVVFYFLRNATRILQMRNTTMEINIQGL
jgi:hypothetical protein